MLDNSRVVSNVLRLRSGLAWRRWEMSFLHLVGNGDQCVEGKALSTRGLADISTGILNLKASCMPFPLEKT